jgi:hypothetical protein
MFKVTELAEASPKLRSASATDSICADGAWLADGTGR